MNYDFKPLDWTHATNIYEVNLRQYTTEGSFKAFARELARLRDMGVETLWFMPITPISQKNRKGILGSYYAASDYVSVNSEFGTLDDFRILVAEAHKLGFKVIIDWVANHTGWDHKWTQEHPEYFEKDNTTGNFKIASGMDDIIELDFHNDALVVAMIDAMKFWVQECDIDGFRCDLAFWVEIEFWKRARIELDEIKPLFWFGELDPIEHPEYMGAFDAAYTWTWMHKTEEFFKNNGSLQMLESILQQYEAIGNDSMRAWFTSNHDENSWNGSEYEKYGDFAKTLAVFSATYNGIPLVYSGQELPNLKRLKFFEKDAISWTGNNELHGFYKTMLKLHYDNPAFHAGISGAETSRINTSAGGQVLAYRRKNGEHEAVVLLNFSKEPVDCSLHENITGNFQEIFSGINQNFSEQKDFAMHPWAYYVFVRN